MSDSSRVDLAGGRSGDPRHLLTAKPQALVQAASFPLARAASQSCETHKNIHQAGETLAAQCDRCNFFKWRNHTGL
jgi:hypothetical protein